MNGRALVPAPLTPLPNFVSPRVRRSDVRALQRDSFRRETRHLVRSGSIHVEGPARFHRDCRPRLAGRLHAHAHDPTPRQGQGRMAGPIRPRRALRSADSRQAARFHLCDRGDSVPRYRRQHRHFHTRQRDRPAPVANRRTIQGRRHLRRRSRWKQLYRVFLSRFHGLPRPQRGVDRAGRVDWPEREAGGQKRRRIRDRAIRIGQLFRIALGTTRSRARVSAGRRATGRCAYRRDREPRLLATPSGRGTRRSSDRRFS